MSTGLKLQGWATVVATGSSCVGGMAWESPYIRIRMAGGGTDYVWHSDTVPERHGLSEGDSVYVDAFAYGDRLRRVSLCRALAGKNTVLVVAADSVTEVEAPVTEARDAAAAKRNARLCERRRAWAAERRYV